MDFEQERSRNLEGRISGAGGWKRLSSGFRTLCQCWSGTAQAWASLTPPQRALRYLIDCSLIGGVIGYGFVRSRGGLIPEGYGYVVDSTAAFLASTAGFDLFFGYRCGRPPTAGQLLSPIREVRNALYQRRAARADQLSREEMHRHMECDYPGVLGERAAFHLGDYQLMYFERTHNERWRQSLAEFLREANRQALALPTVGVELEYQSSVLQETIDHFCRSSRTVYNEVPLSYTTEFRSEVRVLPASPYSFRWLMHHVMAGLPEDRTPSVQITVGAVDDERMPTILLALYFMHPSCVFRPVPSPSDGTIGFPGAYVGQSVARNGALILRQQTNYLAFYSMDSDVIADAALFAAKLHNLSPPDFHAFQEELFDSFFGENEAADREGVLKQIRQLYQWLSVEQAHPELTRLLTAVPLGVWPQRSSPPSAYQMPRDFISGAIDIVKQAAKVLELEDRSFNLAPGEIEAVHSLNSRVREVVERHCATTAADFSYRCRLEEILSPAGGL